MTEVDDGPTISVVIPTIERPEVLDECLVHLERQDRPPEEVIVVDASAGDETSEVVTRHRGVRYLRNGSGLGSLTESRQIGLDAAFGDVVAFLDDDAFASAGWCAALRRAYGEPDVGGVGGRVRSPNLAPPPPDVPVGRLYEDGRATGWFDADVSSVVEVDHLMGANMSYRSCVLHEIGGVPQLVGGRSNHHEDLLVSLTVRRAGYRLLFAPDASVLHIGAPQPVGRRFDLGYHYWSIRNYLYVLGRVYGPDAPIVRRAARALAVDQARSSSRAVAGAAARLAVTIGGLAAGLRSARAASRSEG